MALVLFLASLTPAAQVGQRPAILTGIVKNQDGQPVAGAAVFIRTAGPRQGVGHL